MYKNPLQGNVINGMTSPLRGIFMTIGTRTEFVEIYHNTFNNITVDDKIKFDAAAEESMKQRAVENGLLEKAQNNAEDILRRLLIGNPAVGDKYTIEFVIDR